jgi:hypothetical protein
MKLPLLQMTVMMALLLGYLTTACLGQQLLAQSVHHQELLMSGAVTEVAQAQAAVLHLERRPAMQTQQALKRTMSAARSPRLLLPGKYGQLRAL